MLATGSVVDACSRQVRQRNRVQGPISGRRWVPTRVFDAGVPWRAPFGSISCRESDERVSRERQKVRRNHGAHRARLKRSEPFPPTLTGTECALEKRHDGFDSSSKVPQLVVDPAALDPVHDVEARPLVEHGVGDSVFLERVQVLERCEAGVEGCLFGTLTEQFSVSLHHLDCQSRVARVAIENDQIGDEVRATCR